MIWSRTTAPTGSVIALADLRLQCRIPDDQTDENDLLEALALAADGACEAYTNRGLLPQTWTLGLPDWFTVVDLPMAAPLRSVSSVKYRAADGTLATVDSSDYLTESGSDPARIVRAPNVSWPSLQSDRLASRVEIAYTVGYDNAAAVPAPIRQGLLLLASHWYWERQAVNVGNIVSTMPFGVEALWAPYRVWTMPMVAA